MQCSTVKRALSRVAFLVTPGGARHRALRDLRRWEEHKGRYGRERRVAANGHSFAKQAALGGLRPWDMGTAATVLRKAAGRRVVELLGWVLGAERAFARRGLRACHRNFARALGCSERTAGDTVRAAVRAGYLERCPWFSRNEEGERKQRECVYQLTPELRKFLNDAKTRGFVRGLLVGKSCQAPKVQRTLSFSVQEEEKKEAAARGIDCHSQGASAIDTTPGRAAAAQQAPERARARIVPGELRAALPLPEALRAALPDDMLPEVAAALAAFDRRFSSTN